MIGEGILFICKWCSMLYRAARRDHGMSCICGVPLKEWPR